MSTRNGTNIARRLIEGNASNISEELRSIHQTGNAPQYFRAVVTEVIYDPYFYSTEQKQQLKNNISNPEFIDSMPSNSIIARLITDNQDSFNLPSLFYPFFQSHIMFPLIPGEQVFIIYEDYQKQGSSLGRWVTRIHEDINIEDQNFTHSDRRFLFEEEQRTSRATETRSQIPTFPNGGNNSESYSLRPTGNTNPYEDIFRNAEGSKIQEYENIPRWRKRPQELVLQGMNNSIIILGQDRVAKAQRNTDDTREIKSRSGMIDIVAGRGRYPVTSNETSVPNNKKTSSLTIENSRHKFENDKTHANKQINQSEGDPDFQNDAARLLIAMNTKGDTNFKLIQSTDSNVGINFPANTLRNREVGSDSEPATTIGNSYAILKADHVRIVGRKSELPDGGTINGSVLIAKEGVADQDLSYFYINKDGMMQLEGKKIFLGKAVTSDIASNDHAEPYIKWSVYNNQINELKTQINRLADHIQTMEDAFKRAFTLATAVPYSPVASLVTVGNTPPFTPLLTEIKQNVSNIDPSVAKSIKIFGE